MIQIIYKKCGSCKIEQPLSNFYRSKGNKIYSRCKECDNIKSKAYQSTIEGRKNYIRAVYKARLKNRYNLSLEDYDNLLLQQEGKCLICDLPERRKSRYGVISGLSVDHNHETGKIRGLLCHNCNTGIGKFGDSIEMLEKAITYLKTHDV